MTSDKNPWGAGEMPDFMVRPGLWSEDCKIAYVQRTRHTVIFPGRDEPSSVTFCNNCGEPFCGGGCIVEEKP